MTVSTTDSVIEYVSGGPAFPIPYRFLQDSDIEAVLVKQDGTSETLTGAQYTLTGAGSQSGGTLTSSYAAGFLGVAGASLTISRVMDPVQPTDLRNQGKFLAETHETVFDRLTMLIQQGFSILGRALLRPIGKNYYDAEGRQVKNVADPTSQQDAATKSWTETYLGGLIGAITGNPNLANNVGYVTPRGSAGVVQDMSNTADPLKGAAYVARATRHINSLTELRALAGQYDGEVVYLRGRSTSSRLGQGMMVWVAASVLADNDGTIFGALAGGRWIRPGTDNEVLAEWFGVGNDGLDYSDQLQAAINFAGAAAGGAQGMIVKVPRGTVGISKTINIPNRVGIQGPNGRGGVIKAIAPFTGIYMFSATNGSTSMFASWMRDLFLDARGVNFTAIVYTTGWQETCGMQRVAMLADGTTANGILYEVGAGGAAMWEVLDCEIFIDSIAATRNAIRVNQVSSVGGFLMIVRNCTLAGSSTNQLTRGIFMANDSLHVEGLHLEYTGIGLLAGVSGNLSVHSMTGAFNNVTTMIAIPSGFVGTWDLGSILPNGATTTFTSATSGEIITGRIAHYAGPKRAPTSLWTGSLSTGSATLSRAVQPGELLMFGISAAYAGMQQAAVIAVRGTTFNVSFGSNASAILALSADGLTVTVNSITAGFALDRVNATLNYV